MKIDLIDLCELLGRSVYRIPTAMRLPDDNRAYCSSLAALYGDPNVDPRSGGLLGYPMMCEAFGREQRQTERILRGPHGQGVIRWYGDIPATHVNTADEILRRHKLDVSETRRRQVSKRFLANLAQNSQPIETHVTEQGGGAQVWRHLFGPRPDDSD